MAIGVVQVDYQVLERIATQFAEEQKHIKAVLKNLHHHNDKLRRGGWIAEAADVFYQDMDNRVFPSLDRLVYALGQSEVAVWEIVRLMHLAEDDACVCLRGDGAGAGSIAGLGLGALEAGIHGEYSKWITMPKGSDGRWYGAFPDEAQAIVVNGIRTYDDGLRNLMDGAADELGIGRGEVLGVYNATEGTNIWGSLQDSSQAIADKFQAWTGIRIGPENPAVLSLMDAIKQTGGTVPIIAHSQGGAITAAAIWELYDQGYDVSHLKVITMGSAEFFFPPGPQYEHRVNPGDVVPVLGGYYSYDPITLTKHAINGDIDVKELPNVEEHHSSQGYFDDF